LWSHIQGLDGLNACKSTVVFDTILHRPINDHDNPLTLRACSFSKDSNPSTNDPSGPPSKRDGSSFKIPNPVEGCNDGAEAHIINVNPQLILSGAGEPDQATVPPGISDASAGLLAVLNNHVNCEAAALFAKSGSTTFGIYVGAAIQKSSAIRLLEQFTLHLQSERISADKVSVQLCGERRPNRQMMGIFVDTSGNTTAVHEALRTWDDAKCVTDFDQERAFLDVELGVFPTSAIPLAGINARVPNKASPVSLATRAQECKAVQVASGDGCYSLAESCGISEDDFKKFNPTDGLCTDPTVIQPGQHYCCSEGDMPDFSPQPDADGYCATHVVRAGDECWKLATTYNTTPEKIDENNKKSWGWVNCESIQRDQIICVGRGKPPMPAIIADAQCGPQKPGTQRPNGDTNLADLNPCPLNSCCNIWGKCGTTADFCVKSPAGNGAPGAVKPGSNGCISNCGMGIVNNDKPPDSFIDLVYFEAWNPDRPCSNMDVTEIPDRYTHIHFAFADITPEFAITTARVQEQFDKFKKLTTAKRILSFGGWAFSTEVDTYRIFRSGVQPENADRFASSVAQFIISEGLHGVDFDWEYPGAPDLDVGADDPENGDRYLEFLKLIRQKLPKEKSIAIAAPASFWYLKAYPIDEIAKVVDYIVYMTYDLHGQWDYDIFWARYVLNFLRFSFMEGMANDIYLNAVPVVLHQKKGWEIA